MLQHFTHKLIIASASLLAALSIIFAGYSAWTFTTERREDIATGVSITQAVLRGSFDTTEFPQMIVIEQNGVRFFLMDSLGPSYEK